MLLVLMSSTSFANELDHLGKFELIPPTMRTDLVLPACTWNEDETICQRTAEDEKIILELYTAYAILMKHRPKIEEVLTFDQKIFYLAEQSLAIAEESINDQAEYNDHIYNRLEDCDDAIARNRRRAVVKNILIGLGAGLAGLGVGLTIGIIAE